jgi:hypothetical protein
MDARLMEFLLRSEVAKLPEEKRRIYQYIVAAEDSLAERADTADEFRRLLLLHSPFDRAVEQFNLPYDRLVELLNEIEAELGRKVEERCKGVKWHDYTETFIGAEKSNSGKRVYLFIN